MPTAKPVKLFRDKEAGDAEPYVVWTDVACGEYDAASVFYRHPVTFQHVRDALNKLYGAFETPNPSSADRAQVPFSKDPPMMALWRIVDPRITSEERAILTIQLTTDEDESVRVIYLKRRRGSCPTFAIE